MHIVPRSAFLLALFGSPEPDKSAPTSAQSASPILSCAPELIAKRYIHETVKQNTRALRHCYVMARSRQPDLKGRIMVRFDLKDHQVFNILAVDDTLGDPSLQDCVLVVFQKMTFNLPEGAWNLHYTVTYPVSFVPLEER